MSPVTHGDAGSRTLAGRAAVVDPPSSRMRNGAVGRSWKSDRKTVNVKAHITKNLRVKRRSALTGGV